MAKRDPNLFTPMLAVKYDPAKLTFPKLMSGKLDGIRCVIRNGKALTRSLLPVPNVFIQRMLSDCPAIEGFDGELVVGNPTAPDVYTVTESAVMSQDGEPDFTFLVFDTVGSPLSHIHQGTPYEERLRYVQDQIAADLGVPKRVKYHQHVVVRSLEELDAEEQALVGKLGYEGAMLRDPNGGYKFGRSTVNQGWLLKVKRFEDMEVRVLGFEELMRNNNEKTIDARGYSQRSDDAAGMIPGGTLGKMRVVGLNGPFEGVEFSVGGGKGFTNDLRLYIWTHQEEYLGQVGVVEFFKHGAKDAPRHPGWKGLRKDADRSTEEEAE